MTRGESHTEPVNRRPWLRIGWIVAAAAAIGVRLWNALAGPLLAQAPRHATMYLVTTS